KTKLDPGAPFTPEVLARLVSLKKDDRAAFERLRAELKDTSCRVTELDKSLAGESGESGDEQAPPQAAILISMAEPAGLFHTSDKVAFADIDVNGHRETWPIRSKGFKLWLTRCFYEETGGAPNSEARTAALNVIEAKANFDSPERVV